MLGCRLHNDEASAIPAAMAAIIIPKLLYMSCAMLVLRSKIFQCSIGSRAAIHSRALALALDATAEVQNQNQNQNEASEHEIYASALQACTDVRDICEGRRIHAHMKRRARARANCSMDVLLATKVISIYTKCGFIEDARQVFDEMPHRNSFTWGAIIGGYLKIQQWREVLNLFRCMNMNMNMMNTMNSSGAADPGIDCLLLPKILKAVAQLRAAVAGMEIHAQILKKRARQPGVSVHNSLVNMYAKCGDLTCARQVFDEMPVRDRVSWNAMIAGYASAGMEDEALSVFEWMQSSGAEPNLITWNVVISCHAQKGRISESLRVFRQIQLQGTADVVSWTTLISGFAQFGCHEEALDLFREMQFAGQKFNSATLVSVISACAHLADLGLGEQLHLLAIRSGLAQTVAVGNALTDLYAKCERMDRGRLVFYAIQHRDVVSWNTVIAGYVHAGLICEAYKCFAQMRDEKVGRSIITWNAMISGYANGGRLDEALKLVHEMETEDGIRANVVSWNSVIAGAVQSGKPGKSLDIFRHMQRLGVKCNAVTLLSLLPACAHLADLHLGEELHSHGIRRGYQSEVAAENAVIHMYAKCGRIENAWRVFSRMTQKDLVSWNALIAGCGLHGHAWDAISLFWDLLKADMKPDHITFVGVLSACSHAGLVEEGRKFFDLMIRDFDMDPTIEHYICMVDVLARSGHLEEAQSLIDRMPSEPGPRVWAALLGGCSIHGNAKIARHAAEHLFELEPENAAHYVTLSNIYSAQGRWSDAKMIRTLMNSRGLVKPPACSWIQVEKQTYTFISDIYC